MFIALLLLGEAALLKLGEAALLKSGEAALLQLGEAALLQLAVAACAPCPYDIMHELGAFPVNGHQRTPTDANGHERAACVYHDRTAEP